LARADTATRNVATDGFLRLAEILASHSEQTDPVSAKKEAMIAVATMVGALTISRILTDEAISRALLKSAEEAVVTVR
jgi:TetR/AcrR family transcriptional repressor of nem operon